VEPPPTSDGVAGIRFFYPEAAGGEPAAIPTGDPPSWVLQLTRLVDPGTEVAAVPGRYYYARTGYAIVEGATPQECAARMGALTAPAVP
jgi:hypothetical protein